MNSLDIDAKIAQISGESNWMGELSKVTGGVEDVSHEFYTPRAKIIIACNDNIGLLVKNINQIIEEKGISCPEWTTIATRYNKESGKLNLKKNMINEAKKRTNLNYRSKDLYDSEWFKCVQNFEQTIYKFILDIGIQKDYNKNVIKIDERAMRNLIAIKASFAKNASFYNDKKIYDVPLSETTMDTIGQSFMRIREYTQKIIEIIMYPMYDVKKKITNNASVIEKIFNNKKFAKELDNVYIDDVINMLHDFIVAKYRNYITGTSNAYAALFMNSIGNTSAATADPSRIVELVNSINIDGVDLNENTSKFVLGSKELINQLMKEEVPDVQSAIKRFSELFNAPKVTNLPDDSIAKTEPNDLL